MAEAAPAPVAPTSAPTDAQHQPGSPAAMAGGKGGGGGTNLTPIDGGKSAAAAPTKAEPRPLAEEFEALLKARGGALKVKAGGKEHDVKSLDQLIRYAQRGIPYEQSATELAEQRSKLEPVLGLLQALNGDDDTAQQALDALLGERHVKLAERRLLKEMQKEKSLEGYSEREKQMARQLQSLQQQQAKAEAERKDASTRAEQQAQQARLAQHGKHLSEVAMKALETAGLPTQLGPESLALLRPLMEASLRSGQELDPQALAEELTAQHQAQLKWATSNLEGEKLLDFLGPELAKRYGAALLARHRGGQPQGSSSGATSSAPTPKSEKWDPRRLW